MSNKPVDPRQLVRNTEFLRSLARSLAGDEHLGEDLAQEAALAALESPPGDAKGARAWLRGVVRNLVRQGFRRERRRRDRERSTGIEGRRRVAPAASEVVGKGELLDLVADTVLELEEPYRTTVIQRFYFELAPREIAARAGIPVETVRTRLKRSLQMLRGRLDERCDGDRRLWLGGVAGWWANDSNRDEPRFSEEVVDVSVTEFRSRRALWFGASAATIVSGLGLVALLWEFDSPAEVRRGELFSATMLAGPSTDFAASHPSMELESNSTLAEGRSGGESSKPSVEGTAGEFGSLRGRVRWHDGSPAAGVSLWIVPRSSLDDQTYRPGQGRRVLSDSAGSFSVDGLEAGWVSVLIRRSVTFWDARIQPGVTTELSLDLEPGIDLLVHAWDENRQPLEGVEILLASEHRSEDFGTVVGRTGADGTLMVRGFSRSLFLGARSPGRNPSTLVWIQGEHVQRQETRAFILEGPGARVRGLVLGPDSRPLAGAMVFAEDAAPMKISSEVWAHGPVMLPLPLRTVADAEGRFLLEGLRPTSTDLWVVSPSGSAHHEVLDFGEDLVCDPVVVLGNPVRLVGRVRDALGRPVCGAILTGKDRVDSPFRPLSRCTSGEGGLYRLEGLTAGEIEVTATGPGDEGKARIVFADVSGDTENWDPVLSPGVTLRGRVVTESGASLEGWTVRSWGPYAVLDPEVGETASALAKQSDPVHPVDPEERRRELGRRTSTTQKGGRFLLPNCMDCPHRLEVFPPAEANRLQPAVLQKVNVVPGDGEILLEVPDDRLPTSGLVGRLTGLQPEGWGVGRVQLVSENLFDPRLSAEVSPEGRFRFERLVPGTYRLLYNTELRLAVSDLKTVSFGEVAIPAGVTVDYPDQKIGPPGAVVLQFDYDRRVRRREALFEVMDEEKTTYYRGNLRGDTAAVEGLNPGRYWFCILATGKRALGATAIPFEVESSRTTELRFAGDMGFQCFVHFVADETVSWWQVRDVEFSRSGGEFVARLFDVRRWLLEDGVSLLPGGYRVRVTFDSGETWIREIEVSEEEGLVQEFRLE